MLSQEQKFLDVDVGELLRVEEVNNVAILVDGVAHVVGKAVGEIAEKVEDIEQFLDKVNTFQFD